MIFTNKSPIQLFIGDIADIQELYLQELRDSMAEVLFLRLDSEICVSDAACSYLRPIYEEADR